MPLLFGGIACWTAALWLAGPNLSAPRDLARGFVRPLVLPFLWRSLSNSEHGGSAAEMFARSRQLMEWLPQWGDGYALFAYRWALDGGDTAAPVPERQREALARLQEALAYIDEAREQQPSQAVDLLLNSAFLVEMAVNQEPGLADLMRSPASGLGDPEVLADKYLQKAERLGGGQTVREQRLFLVPRLMAAFLRPGDRDRAFTILDKALEDAVTIRDRELAIDWRETLQKVRAILSGDRNTDVDPLLADPRLAPLIPWLRQ